MIHAITKWLKEPDKNFKEGLSIYLQLRTDRKYDNFFNQQVNPPKDSFAFQLLFKEVERLFRINQKELYNIPKTPIGVKQTPVKMVKKTPGNRPRISDHPYIDIRELPEDMKKLYRENKTSYKEMARMHTEAKSTSISDEQRKGISDKLLEMESKNRKNWEIIDEWYKHRNDPKKTLSNEENLTVAKLKDLISLTENYVRRYRSNMAKATDEKAKERAKKHFDKFTAELKELKDKLKKLV